MWPLRNSIEEGHVAFHLLEALLASALIKNLKTANISRLFARPEKGLRLLLFSGGKDRDLFHTEVSPLTYKCTSRLLLVVSFKTLVSLEYSACKRESSVFLSFAQARFILCKAPRLI